MTDGFGASRRRQCAAVAALLVAVMAGVTWPQVTGFSSQVADHWDPFLSVWRLAWIAHQLVADPRHLFDAPIFHPETRTLAYTDAVLLPGLAAAPLVWLGVPLVAVYNTMLIGSIVLSGVGAGLLANRLTGNPLASLVAALAFAVAPYRFDHYEHLELQASFGLPWTLLALEAWWAHGRWRDACGVAIAFTVQVLCSIYYAVFLATLAPFYVLIRFGPRGLFVTRRTDTLRVILALMVAGVLLLPYLTIYSRNHAVVGERDASDVAVYSATIADFVHVHPKHLLLGRWLGEDTISERRLFPGITIFVLATLACVVAPSRRTFALSALVVGATLIALGSNGPLFPFLRDTFLPYRGLRVPSRAAMVGQLALSVLGAIAVARLLPAARVRAAVLVGLLGAGIVIDGLHVPLDLIRPSAEPLEFSTWLKTVPNTVVVELPLPTPEALYVADGQYMFAAAVTRRWNSTLNGYSGFYPQSFSNLIDVMQTFPDDRTVAYLRSRGVDWVAVHQSLYMTDDYGALLGAMIARPELVPAGRFGRAGNEVMVFRVLRSTP
jgi:hypothetical protein